MNVHYVRLRRVLTSVKWKTVKDNYCRWILAHICRMLEFAWYLRPPPTEQQTSDMRTKLAYNPNTNPPNALILLQQLLQVQPSQHRRCLVSFRSFHGFIFLSSPRSSMTCFSSPDTLNRKNHRRTRMWVIYAQWYQCCCWLCGRVGHI